MNSVPIGVQLGVQLVGVSELFPQGKRPRRANSKAIGFQRGKKVITLTGIALIDLVLAAEHGLSLAFCGITITHRRQRVITLAERWGTGDLLQGADLAVMREVLQRVSFSVTIYHNPMEGGFATMIVAKREPPFFPPRHALLIDEERRMITVH